mgnify:CR=1 FL=1
MDIKGIILDMDGVIMDSERFSRDDYQQLSVRYHITIDKPLMDSVLGVTGPEGDRIFAQALGDSRLAALIRAEHRRNIRLGYAHGSIPMKRGAYELVDFLARSHFPTALATSNQRSAVEAAFRHTPFGAIPMTVVVTGEDVMVGKPDPEIFLTAGRKLQIPINCCLVVEDSFNGVRAAHASGARCFMVPDTVPPTEAIASMTDSVKKDLFEVLEMVRPAVSAAAGLSDSDS